MNARYNNEVFADTATGRKALLQKVKDEVAAGRVNVSDKSAVEQDILKGEPTDASSKMQFGDIERMLFMAWFCKWCIFPMNNNDSEKYLDNFSFAW